MRIEVFATSLKAELPMTNSIGISPLRQRMIDDMVARGLVPQTQKGHVRACKRFAAYLKRSPELATADDVRLFQLHLLESGLTIQNRNRTMTGVRFLLAVTMRRQNGLKIWPCKWRSSASSSEPRHQLA